MWKKIGLLAVVIGLLASCSNDFWDDISGDSDTAEITIMNGCPWQVTIDLVSDSDTQSATVRKSSVKFTVQKDVNYRIEIKGVWDTSTSYFEKTFSGDKYLKLSWSAYTASYQLASY